MKNAIDAWKWLLQEVLDKGYSYVERDARECIECMHLSVVVDDIHKSSELPILKLSQITDWKYPALSDIAKGILVAKEDKYLYSYANRLFHYKKTLNQIDEFVIPKLKQNKYSRKAVAVLYDPLVDSLVESKEIPSITTFHFLIRSDALHVAVFIRSCDVFLGFPANVYQTSCILEYICEKLDLKKGKATFFFGSAHIMAENTEYITSICHVNAEK